MRRLVVVGGGITGLAAALRLRDRFGSAAEITVYEQSSRLGGKLRTGELAGITVERGADAFLVRDPAGGDSAAVGLARRVGLGDQLVNPAAIPADLLLAGSLRPIPGGTLLGVPGDPSKAAPVATVALARDVDRGRPVLPAGADVAVGQLVRDRFGDEVVDRLVDPLLGGVYAGRADELSLAATMPGLATAAATATTLTAAVRVALAAAPRPPGTPVFASIQGGLSRLVESVAAASKARIRLGRPVRELRRTPAGWRLLVGSTRDVEPVVADAVVLALPARPAARLLRGLDEAVADQVAVLDYASVALVTLAYPAEVELPARSGFLVPAGEGLALKAATFFTRKWPAAATEGGPVLVRASVGRYAEPELLRLADAALADRVHTELAEVLGGLPAPTASAVQRWGGALPQYPPGQLARVALVRAALPATLAVAGAGYDGVGIPACIRSGEAAGDRLAAGLGESQA